ncbi:MAG: hypothetical protein K6E38_07030 [Fretibacterium sp.]|nr:hypothetical protein [Fretibacterium sp.]
MNKGAGRPPPVPDSPGNLPLSGGVRQALRPLCSVLKSRDVSLRVVMQTGISSFSRTFVLSATRHEQPDESYRRALAGEA